MVSGVVRNRVVSERQIVWFLNLEHSSERFGLKFCVAVQWNATLWEPLLRFIMCGKGS